MATGLLYLKDCQWISCYTATRSFASGLIKRGIVDWVCLFMSLGLGLGSDILHLCIAYCLNLLMQPIPILDFGLWSVDGQCKT